MLLTLYHTSDQIIKDPDIFHGRKNADFGQGFYLTPDIEFSRRWAFKDSYINKYELDTTGLSVKRFQRDREWFDYIFNNRNLTDGLNEDVIEGPIANDTIFDTLGIISSGYLKPEDAVKLLLIGPEYTQVVIKTPKARANLKWIDAFKVDATDQRQKEEEEYLILLAQTLEQIQRSNEEGE